MNLPNLLSLIRLLLVPVFAAVFFSGGEYATQWALAIYVLASLTDILDGSIARRYHLITKLGRILDPLADKLMGAAVILCIALSGLVPWWAVAVFVLKELMMIVGALVLYKKDSDVPPSNWLGKSATFSFFVVCVVLMLFPAIPRMAASIMIGAALALSVASMVTYAVKYFRLGRQMDSKE